MINEKYQQLNPEQASAVNQTMGSVMAVAGPGTGKTQMLSLRIAKILQSELDQVHPANILAITYTDAGVKAIRKRLVEFIGPQGLKIQIHTFHSLCNEIILCNASRFAINDFEPISELESVMILRKIVDGLPDENLMKRTTGNRYFDIPNLLKLTSFIKRETTDPLNTYLYPLISDLKTKPKELSRKILQAEIKPKEYDTIEGWDQWGDYIYKVNNSKKNIIAGSVKQNKINDELNKTLKLIDAEKICRMYCDEMIQNGRYDFDDMISYVVNEFEMDPDFLMSYQERYQYVLVDEFQDTTGLQHRFLELLMDFWDDPNVFVVGDDDQSLYEFNGARVQGMIDFKKKFSPKVVVLKQNYRSTSQILAAAGQLITHNTTRIVSDKELVATRTASKQTVNAHIVANEMHEASHIVSQIIAMEQKGIPYNEMAVIYRKHSQCVYVMNALLSHGIPIAVKKKKNLLDTRIVRVIMSMVKYCRTGHVEYLVECLMSPYINIPANEVDQFILEHNKGKKITSALCIDYCNKLSQLRKEMAGASPTVWIHSAVDTGKLYNEDIWGQEELNAIVAFETWIRKETIKNPEFDLLEATQRMKDHKLFLPSAEVISNDGVNFLTAHASKGLEFEAVFIIGANAQQWEKSRKPPGISLPSVITKSEPENDFQANLRLFYVAMTRAKTKLTIYSHVNDINNRLMTPTEFIDLSGITAKTLPIDYDEKFVIKTLVPGMFHSLPLFKINAETINDILDNYVLSPSGMNKYMECSKKFYYEDVLRTPHQTNFAIVKGNILHQWMDKTSGTDMEVLNDIIEKHKIHLPFGEHEALHQLCRGTAKKWKESNYKATGLNEYKIGTSATPVIIDGIPCRIIVDNITSLNEKDVRLTDYKTGTSAIAKSRKGQSVWRQGVFYTIVTEEFPYQKWKVPGPFRVVLLNPNEIKIIDIPITEDDKKEVKQLMSDTYKSIKNLEFSKGCGECKWCNL